MEILTYNIKQIQHSPTDVKKVPTARCDYLAKISDICLCLPPDRTWHKVNDPKVDYSGDLGEVMVGHEPRLEPCWTMLVIGPLCAMWAWWAYLVKDSNLGLGTYAWL